MRIQRHDAHLGHTVLVQALQAVGDGRLAITHAQGHGRLQPLVQFVRQRLTLDQQR